MRLSTDAPEEPEPGATGAIAVQLTQEYQMPAIADPYRARPYDAPLSVSGDDDFDGSHSLRLRLRTARRRAELTRALAEGADPTTRPELALRAAQLTSDRSRRMIARSLHRTISEAHQPAMTRARMVVIRRAAVLDAEGAISAMIERLHSPEPVQAQGMALVERILTNAYGSPLYNDGEAGMLHREMRVATAALEADRAQSNEFPIAA